MAKVGTWTELAGKGRPQTLTGAEEARWKYGEARPETVSNPVKEFLKNTGTGAPQPTNKLGREPAESPARDLDGSERTSLGGGEAAEAARNSGWEPPVGPRRRGRGC